MRLRQLTGLEQDKLRAEYDEILKTIEELKDILARKERRMQIIKEELLEYELEESDLDEATVTFIKANGLSAMLG
jgi:DNA gyrase subunit A